MLKKSAIVHGPWCATHEIYEKGVNRSSKFRVRNSENLELRSSNPPSFRSSRLSHAIILGECSPVVRDLQTIEFLGRQL